MRPLYIFILLSLLPFCLFSAPAFPGTLSFSQNDGEQFKGKLKGDEWLHWISLANDYVALYNPTSKNYEYAQIKTVDGKNQLVPSGLKVDERLHKLQPLKLSRSVAPLDSIRLSKLYREPKAQHTQKSHIKKSNYKNKSLKTKSTQWKEVLKEENPLK